MRRLWMFSILLVAMTLIIGSTWNFRVFGNAPVGGDYGMTTRESVSDSENQGNADSTDGRISDDGRWLAFASHADNLVAADTNGYKDIFLRDRVTGTTTRVSMGYSGAEATSFSELWGLSADGGWVLFSSSAANVVPNDTNEAEDLFLWERATGTTRRVSVSSTGMESMNIYGILDADLSADGRYAVFVTDKTGLVPNDTNNRPDVFVHDRVTAETSRVSVSSSGTQANDSSVSAHLSSDGRFVAFAAYASNLVPNDTNDTSDIFVHDRQTGLVERVNQRTNGSQSSEFAYQPAISGDGRLVAFATWEDLATGAGTSSTTLYWYDRLSDTITLAVTGADGNRVPAIDPHFSHNGQRLFFTSSDSTLVPGDTNGIQDVFEVNLPTGVVQRLSLGTYNEEGAELSYLSGVSGDGHFVVWDSASPQFVSDDTNSATDVFLRERRDTPPPSPTPTATATPTVTPTPRIPPYPNEQFLPLIARQARVSDFVALNLTAIGNAPSIAPVTSRDGSVVAFTSAASNLVPNDTNNATDIFVWDRASGQITRVSVSGEEAQLAGNSERPALSEDGRYVVYTAWADGVVPQDTNGKADIYRYDRQTGEVMLVSVRPDGGSADGNSLYADLSADGTVVFFTSEARNLIEGGVSGVPDGATVGFIRNLVSNTTLLLNFNGVTIQGVDFPSISDDGRKVAFTGGLSLGLLSLSLCRGQPVGSFDVETGVGTTIELVESNHRWEYLPYAPRISPDGRQVGYRFYAEGGTRPEGYMLNVAGATSYTVMNHQAVPIKACDGPGSTPRLSFSTSGEWVAFSAYDLAGQNPDMPGDTNGVDDIFLWDNTTHRAEWISKPKNALSNGASFDAYISGDGRTIAFASDATNLSESDTNGVTDIFVWETAR